LTVHFKPLWARNAPRFGIAHALAMGVRSRTCTRARYVVVAVAHSSLHSWDVFVRSFVRVACTVACCWDSWSGRQGPDFCRGRVSGRRSTCSVVIVIDIDELNFVIRGRV